MSSVESAAAAGDSYSLRQVLLADGTGAIVGSALGCCPLPARGLRRSARMVGRGRQDRLLPRHRGAHLRPVRRRAVPLLDSTLPVPAIVPVLLYIGLVIGARAFRSVPRAHYAAVVLAIVANAAAWASGLIENALTAA